MAFNLFYQCNYPSSLMQFSQDGPVIYIEGSQVIIFKKKKIFFSLKIDCLSKQYRP